MTNKLTVMLSGMMFFLLPWYYWDSGQPQPVDIPIVILLGLFFSLGLPFIKKLLQSAKIFKTFLCFSIYAVISLLINYIIDANDATLIMLIHSVYCIILAVIFCILLLYLEKIKGDRFYNFALILLLLDLLLPFGKWIFLRSIGSREPLTFSNANQLGFFTLVNLSILFYTALLAREKNIALNKIYVLIILNINFLFLFVSTSRACYTAVLLYALTYFVVFRIKLRGYTKWLFGIFGLFLFLFFVTKIGQVLLLYMRHTRLDVDIATTSSLFGEFYFRAFKGIESNFTDAWTLFIGTGNYTTSGRHALEFHNNFVAIFFQVGLIGLLLYLYLNIVIIMELFKKGVFYLLPYLCYIYYSMFHYSHRTRINWLLLAMIIFISLIDYKRTPQKQISNHPS